MLKIKHHALVIARVVKDHVRAVGNGPLEKFATDLPHLLFTHRGARCVRYASGKANGDSAECYSGRLESHAYKAISS